MVWDRKIKTPQSRYGMATSPILHKNKVILVLDDDSRDESRLLAVNSDTGQTGLGAASVIIQVRLVHAYDMASW